MWCLIKETSAYNPLHPSHLSLQCLSRSAGTLHNMPQWDDGASKWSERESHSALLHHVTISWHTVSKVVSPWYSGGLKADGGCVTEPDLWTFSSRYTWCKISETARPLSGYMTVHWSWVSRVSQHQLPSPLPVTKRRWSLTVISYNEPQIFL